jgi:hypothetical protein
VSGHSRFGASAAHRWMRCPGSIQATEGLPNVSSPAALEGTLLHEAAALVLEGKVQLMDLATDARFLLDEEQIDVVRVYVGLVNAEYSRVQGWALGVDRPLDDFEMGGLLIETRVNIPSFAEFTGTADAIIYGETWIKIVDLKCGRGVNVEASYGGKVNPQLGFYALGAIAQFPGWKPDDIEVIICQPRYGGVKSRRVTPAELRELESQMLDAVVKATSDNPPFAAGSHCNFCLARATCPTLRDYVYKLARMDFDDFATAPV